MSKEPWDRETILRFKRAQELLDSSDDERRRLLDAGDGSDLVRLLTDYEDYLDWLDERSDPEDPEYLDRFRFQALFSDKRADSLISYLSFVDLHSKVIH